MDLIKKVVVVLFFLLLNFTMTSQNNPNFKRIKPTLNNAGVSVSKTIQGPFNTIWMACNSGILVYDGYDYKLIDNKVVFPKQEANQRILKLELGSNGNIWVLSQHGVLSKYRDKTGAFEIVKTKSEKTVVTAMAVQDSTVWYATNSGSVFKYVNSSLDSITTVSRDYLKKPIQSLVVNKNEELFLSTLDGRLFNYNIKTDGLEEINGVFTDFPGNLILELDTNNKLWIGTEIYGLLVYDIIKRTYIQETFFTGNTLNVKNELFSALKLDSKGNIWGGTDGGGLYKINSKTGDIELFTRNVSNDFSLSSNTVLNVSEDYHNNIWVTTNYGEVNVLPSPTPSIKYHSGAANGVPQRILSILKSSTEVLWIGTDGAGITKVVMKGDKIISEKQYFNNVFRDKGFYIQSIVEDNKKNIWVGTYKNGLWYYNSEKETFKKLTLSNSKKHHATDVRTIFNDSQGRIWVGSNISLNVYTANLELLASFETGLNGLEGNIVDSIYEDEDQHLWFGVTYGGIFEFEEKPNNISNSVFINHTPNDAGVRKDKYTPKSMTSGGDHVIWAINRESRLLKYNTATKTFTSFENSNVFSNKNFSSVVSENEHSIWLGSLHGVGHFKLKDSLLVTYYNSDGFEDNSYLGRSVFKDKQGNIYFGGVHGVNYFQPKMLKKKANEATLYINDIEVLNRPVDSIINSNGFSDIYNLKTLNLDYEQASFSFRFSALDNVLNQNYHYAYKLTGFDDHWIESHPERVATYTNIPPGKYIFEVKAGTVKGLWDVNPIQLELTIAQPFWRTIWAYVVYGILVLLFIYSMRRWYVFRKNMLMEKVSFRKEHELYDLKMDFFTKMSHEIQTPITLILGPIDDMMQRAEKNGNLLLKQRLKIISNNTNRLSKIARDLTLVRDKELKQLRLSVTKNNLHNDVEGIALSFKELARKKQIDFVINCPKNLTDAWYDKDKIEHVIYNLLSNAFKFTPRDGNIQFSVVPINDKKAIKIFITDSGPGIPMDELKIIFNLFYQSPIGKRHKGSGIGLALTKELIDLHDGSVDVKSSPEEGTSFIVQLPISEDDYLDEDKIVSSDGDVEELPIIQDPIKPSTENVLEADTQKKTILIVEDNLDLQEFLKDLLFNDYNILLAENGEEGYHYAKSNFPDLILSDIMMPILDGVAMCNMLQKDYLTKHIPVILLTAKNSTNSKIFALKSGAIEFINKPFNTNELLLKVKNIIASREHIISQYRAEAISKPEVTIQKSKDEVFLENLMTIVNTKLPDANFKMEELADSLNMSYSSFYRKCQALTGHSIIDFVRLIRLKKGAVILAKFGYTISEVAFMVGFNDPKYFSKCFKKQFGKTPKMFASDAKKEGVENYLKRYSLTDI